MNVRNASTGGLLTLSLMLGTAPASAAEECSLKLVTSLDLSYDVLGRPIVPVTLNGYQRYLLVDTGGADSTLDENPAINLGLQRRRGNRIITNVAGERSDLFVVVEEFILGGLHARDRPFMISAGSSGEDRTTRAIGLLAPDAYVNYDLDLDFGSDKLNIFQQDHCEGAVVYWHPSAIAVIPFELDRNNHIRFPVTLDGVPLTAILDTGAYNTTLNKNIAEQEFGLNFAADEIEQVGVLGENRDEIYSRQFQELSFEGIEISSPTLNILPDL